MSVSVVQKSTPAPPQLDKLWTRVGTGNWNAFRRTGFDLTRVEEAAAGWSRALEGIARPWLCWKVDDDWCLVQQKLVELAGWTPVVGFDPRSGQPKKLIKSAIVVDFNAGLDLPLLYPHFPMEFVFLFCDRLAFWHSDLLLRKDFMRELADRFASLEDGSTIATRPQRGLRYLFTKKRTRYWELVGCTTGLASRRQFEIGCGWWQSFYHHPNCPDEKERERRRAYHFDHGAGIYYWAHYCGGDVIALTDRRIFEGHFTKIGNPNYKRHIARDTPGGWRLMSRELVESYDLKDACAKMGLSDLL